MSTFFDELKTSFKDVPVGTDGGISSLEFIEASEGLIKLFNLLGNPAFSIIQRDLVTNINKLRYRLDTFPDDSKTLQDMVVNERAKGVKVASEGLLWLVRSLEFMEEAIRELVQDSDIELTNAFNKAYSRTLSRYHGVLVRPVFKLVMKATPYRKEFFARLGPDQERVNRETRECLEALEKIVKILTVFLDETCKDL
ncbi:HBL195Cp [Eremothecium sinecaudum]|uniref:HBL195Cp n=1 Tax=Eremothecium sinecaudum TaxID=45286 RepID=A0A120K0U8_9SACH|nr:HBL195Cp [Eremothecium sinecaudum]AMD18707.1 HBL195Cp [Eremothecium sinecaudum]